MSYFYSLKQSNGKKNISSPSSQESDDSANTLIPSASSATSLDDWSRRSSIPWAEDAIKQNQAEWEKIERIFYGEEELPDDEKTREEFKDWMRVFPHLRIVGKPVKIHNHPPDKGAHHHEDNEEILAIDPPLLVSANGRKSSRRNKSRNAVNFDEKLYATRNQSALNHLNNEITNYLKITPSPVMTHKIIETHYEQPNMEDKYYLKIPSTSGIHLIDLPEPSPIVAPVSSFSASHVRMPPIFSIKVLPANNTVTTYTMEDNRSRKSKAVGQLQSRITLPAIDLSSLGQLKRDRMAICDANVNAERIVEYRGRSISAVNEKRVDSQREKYPKSASKIKIIEFH